MRSCATVYVLQLVSDMQQLLEHGACWLRCHMHCGQFVHQA
jgi:hypothetical protein